MARDLFKELSHGDDDLVEIVQAFEALNEDDQKFLIQQIDLVLEVIDEEEEKILDFLDREAAKVQANCVKPTIN